MNIDLSGKRALVTGAASGIGAAIAETYAAAGAHVAVQARTLDKAVATVEGPRRTGRQLLSSPGSREANECTDTRCESEACRRLRHRVELLDPLTVEDI